MKTSDELRSDFWKKDEEDGGLVYSQYKEIKRVLYEQDKNWIKNQYLAIKTHAINNTEFYKQYSVEDPFPVVSKMQLIENYEAHSAKKGYLLPTHISSTSGSTGTPFSVIQDLKKRKRTIADLQVFGELCNYPSRERMVLFRVLSDKLHRTPEIENQENIYYIDSSDLGDKHLGEMVDALIEKKPRIVFSYASTLVELAKFVLNHKISADCFSMLSVLTAGEGISEENRCLLIKSFGCPVYRRYSDMELGILGQDQGAGGKYLLNWGSYYFECLKLDSDESADYGEVGRIVITDLFNYAFPMIRYDTGDLGIMERLDENSLPYLKEIFGRNRDCVYTTKGEILSPAKISVMMWGCDGVKQWQFIQKTQYSYIFKLNVENEIDSKALIEKYKSVLGEDATIYIEYVDEIPVLASNKRRAVICEWKKS